MPASNQRVLTVLRAELAARNGVQLNLANDLNLNSAHISLALKRGKVGNTLRAAMCEAGMLQPPRREYRIAATVASAERQQAARDLAAQFGISWTEFVNAMIDGDIQLTYMK